MHIKQDANKALHKLHILSFLMKLLFRWPFGGICYSAALLGMLLFRYLIMGTKWDKELTFHLVYLVGFRCLWLATGVWHGCIHFSKLGGPHLILIQSCVLLSCQTGSPVPAASKRKIAQAETWRKQR